MAFITPVDENPLPRKPNEYEYRRGPMGDVYLVQKPGETDEEYAARRDAESQAVTDAKTAKAINWERIGIPNMYQTPTPAQVVEQAQKDEAGLPALPTAPMQRAEMKTKELDDLRDMLGEYEKKGNKMDWSPILALTDAWTGSNLAASYDRPMTKEERDKLVMGLKSRIFDAQAKMKQGQDDLSFKLKKWSEERQDKRRGQLVELEKARMYSGMNQDKDKQFSDRNRMSQTKGMMNMYKDTYAGMISARDGLEPDDPKVKAEIPILHSKAVRMADEVMKQRPDMTFDQAYDRVVQRITGGR